ncbi:MAG: AsmA-like C-terminal domain-containing protein [Rickettsiales bacterium]|nr:AsmA-like C-terminal domain-containing protein [Rickettsiales bacterium]
MSLFIKIFGRIIFYSVLFAIIFVSLFLFVFYSEEKTIPPQNINYLEDVIESSGKNVQVYIGSAKAHFEGFKEGFTIIFYNSFINLGEDVIISTPMMKAKIKLSDLLIAKIRFREILVDNPQFLFKATEGKDFFDSSSEESISSIYKSSVAGLFNLVSKDKNIIPVESVVFNNAIFSFNRDNAYQNWKINNAKLSFYSLQNSTYLRTEIKTKILDKESTLIADSRVLKDNKMKVDIEYINFPASSLSEIISDLSWLKKLNPVLNGNAEIMLSDRGASNTISINTDLAFRQKWLKKSKVNFAGELYLIPNEASKIIEPSIKGSVFLESLEMERLPKIWPENIGTEIREQVIKSYSKGYFDKLAVNIAYNFESITFENIIAEKISAKGKIKNSSISFNPRYPTLERVSGEFNLEDDNISMIVEEGYIGEYKFKDITSSLTGLTKDDAILEITGKGSGNLSELKPLLKAITKGRDKDFYYNTHDVHAFSRTKFYYKDNVNNGFDERYLKLDIKSKLKKIIANNVLDKINFASEKGEMIVNNDGVTFNAKGLINNSDNAEIEAFVGFKKVNDVEIKLNGDLSEKNIALIIKDFDKFFTGKTSLTAEYKSLDNDNVFSANLDFEKSEINFPYLSINKKIGEKITAALNGKFLTDKAIEIAKFRITSQGGISEGKAVISRKAGLIADEFYFSKLLTGKNDASIYLSSLKLPNYTDYKIKISGRNFDVSSLVNNYQLLTGEEKTAINLELNVDKLSMSNDVTLNNARGYLRCNVSSCFKSEFTGKFNNEKIFGLTYLPEDENNYAGNKKLYVYTNDVGQLIKGSGLKANIIGGEAKIEGFSDASKDEAIEGSIKMKDYKITEVPVLARIFSLASFTGIADIMTGGGIPMKSLEGEFIIKHEYLSLKNILAYGNSLGITSRGTINLETSELDISGAVTPSYSINSLFNKIPVLNYLTGRKGEGLIATKYFINGKYPDADVSVNAFSALTPGVFREIWGKAETDIDKKTKQNAVK